MQTDNNKQSGGVLPKSKKPSTKTRVSKALSIVKDSIKKPTNADAEYMSIDRYDDEDTEMQFLRRSIRSKVKPEAYMPGTTQPKKTRGPLTEEQKAARATVRKAKIEAVLKAKETAKYALPNPEEIEKMHQKQEVMQRAQSIFASKMEEDLERNRGTKQKQMEERLMTSAIAEAKKQMATEKKTEKKALVSEADILADLFGKMTTTRPVPTTAPVGQIMHSSGHPIMGYDPRDGWPLGINPVTGNIERFSTKDGGKKKRMYKKKSKAQKGGENEVEGAIAENVESLPAPVDQTGGKKKRMYKKKSKAQKGGENEVEGAIAENVESLPAPVDQTGGKKKRIKKQNK
uniref:Uncharacterized protein n=1 Tax=viral metagenome TaxID=1070528 RepID=A0A6C0CU28_9ZZZZ